MQAQEHQAYFTHEQLMQELSAMLLHITSLQMLEGSDGQHGQTLRAGLTTLEQMARDMLLDLRAESEDAPLPELEGVALSAALSRLVEEVAEQLGLSSRVAISGEEHHLAPYLERLLYRVAQEALYQAQFHQGPRKLRFALNYERSQVSMSIEDDGAAPAANDETPVPHFKAVEAQFVASNAPASRNSQRAALAPNNAVRGPFADLNHRIDHLGGSLEISALPEKGTRVRAVIPYTLADGVTRHVANEQEQLTAPSPTTSHPHITLQGAVGERHVTAPVMLDAPTERKVGLVPTVRVLIVEGQAVIRAGLRRLLDSYPGIEVIGEAADGVQAVSETLELGPGVVLMDAQLPNGQSMDALKQIKQLNLETRVVLLSSQNREEYVYETLRAGADGYLLKDILPDELASAIQVVASGEVLVQPQLASRLLSRFGKQGRGTYVYESLTAREQEVLQLLARGLRNKEIAARLYVSERTVNFHLANIYQKLNVSGRTEAMSKALEQGLITA